MIGLRDIVLVLVLIFLVPACFKRPWIGVLGWAWVAYMAPHRLAWGFGRGLPIAVLIGGATLLGYFITRDKDRKPLPRNTGLQLLVLLCVHFTVTTVLAHDPALAYGKWSWVMKSLLMAFVTITIFQDRERLRWLYLVMAGSIAFYGTKGGIWVLRTGGGERVWGPIGTFFEDNNTLGLALCMVLPMLLYLAREEKRRWVKRLLRTAFGLSIIATIFTYSRGAFLGLAVILAVMIWRSPWRLRFATALVIAGVISLPYLPDRLVSRLESIEEQTTVETRDSSAQGRIEAWQTGLNIAMANPLTGLGFRAYHSDAVWDRYFPGIMYMKSRDAHSLYFEVLGEHGFLGFGLYIGLLVWSLLTLRRLRKRWRNHPEHGYLSHYAEMIQLVLVPFLVAGAFLTVAYFDLYFHLLSTVIVLEALSVNAHRAVRLHAVATNGTHRPMRGGAIVPAPMAAESPERRTHA